MTVVLMTLVAATAGVLQGQAAPALTQAAEAITAAGLARHIGVLASDSLQNRAVPSLGVEATARYVTAQFEQLGLAPGGNVTYENGSDTAWVQRYPASGSWQVDNMQARIGFYGELRHRGNPVLSETGDQISKSTTIRFATDVRPLKEAAEIEGGMQRPGSVVLAGPHTAATVERAALGRANVFYVPPRDADVATQEAVVTALYHANPGRAVILVVEEDSATFGSRFRTSQDRPFRVVDEYMVGASAAPHGWAVAVRAAAIAEFLTMVADVDLAQLRAAAIPVVRSLPSISILPFMPADTTRKPGAASGVTDSALNVIGILEGRDPKLKQEYLVFTAHMDPRGPNGADDNASGVAGLLALAKAFNHPTARPRRSIIFLATSGADADFVGSNFFCQPYTDGAVRCSNVVANITLDMVGRPAEDSVLMSGAQELEFAVSPKWVIAMHPELQLPLVNRELVYRPASDYFAFVRRGVPSLYFHNGDHHESSTNPEPKALTTAEAMATIDAEQAARIMRLVFYIGHNVAEAQQRPRWTAEGRGRRLQMLGSE